MHFSKSVLCSSPKRLKIDGKQYPGMVQVHYMGPAEFLRCVISCTLQSRIRGHDGSKTKKLIKQLLACGKFCSATSFHQVIVEERNQESDKIPLIRMLLDAGADPNMWWESNFSNVRNMYRPLMMAVWRKHLNIATMLIESGAVIRGHDIWDGVPTSPLAKALENKSEIDFIRKLLELGADPNFVWSDWREVKYRILDTLFGNGYACYYYRSPEQLAAVISLLLGYGADQEKTIPGQEDKEDLMRRHIHSRSFDTTCQQLEKDPLALAMVALDNKLPGLVPRVYIF
ncbi:uncharacterized protein BDZ99DRAFT_259937 [Mytilinidion resinicola]|uniref:Ankyrin n=1 Tax=Mytilinidion resinicola TaxID=574789 RepID=A0A6A6YTD7_9PEZI|nr:uncharacterized protein BDZ99DRAFT_259937 [Mytilinidion resinicola]KAF2812031.1 hypothetical protein BDZ99DRAFT_259937 [Mytilinidion resinicola]